MYLTSENAKIGMKFTRDGIVWQIVDISKDRKSVTHKIIHLDNYQLVSKSAIGVLNYVQFSIMHKDMEILSTGIKNTPKEIL